MFFLGGGKCPNLGVVNVRILGVVNVRLANNLTPTNVSQSDEIEPPDREMCTFAVSAPLHWAAMIKIIAMITIFVMIVIAVMINIVKVIGSMLALV